MVAFEQESLLYHKDSVHGLCELFIYRKNNRGKADELAKEKPEPPKEEVAAWPIQTI